MSESEKPGNNSDTLKPSQEHNIIEATPEEKKVVKDRLAQTLLQVWNKADVVLGGIVTADWFLIKRSKANGVLIAAYGIDICKNYSSYHQIISGDTGVGTCPGADFPDEPKAQTICEKWLEELNNKSACLQEVQAYFKNKKS